MSKPEIKVVYHAEPTPYWTYPDVPLPPTIGIKLTVGDTEIGQWRKLREDHTLQDVLTELATCCVLIACGDALGALEKPDHDEVMRFLGVAKVAE